MYYFTFTHYDTSGFEFEDFITYYRARESCCNHDGMRSDANYNMVLNVQDLTYLVNYLFKSGPEPPCFEEGDANGDGTINVQDLTYLVNYLFKAGPAPVPCP